MNSGHTQKLDVISSLENELAAMETSGIPKTISPRQCLSISHEKPMPDKEQVKKVWALFETDEVGNPQKKVASSGSLLFNRRAEIQEHSATLDSVKVSNQKMALVNFKNSPCSSLPFQSMVQDWEISDLIRDKWQHDIVELQISHQKHWKTIDQVHAKKDGKACSMLYKMCSDNAEKHQDSNMALCEKGGCGFTREDKFEKIEDEVAKSKDDDKETDMVLPTYRLHVENPEGDDFSMSFAAPLILNRTLLEKKLNCCGKDLQSVNFLNLNHEGLSSLGESILSQWCPKTRIFTADMNRLNSLSNAFAGYEETLEQLSLKDNFLCDFKGLECLHKLQVVHLDGNYILQLVGCSSILSNKNCEGYAKNDTNLTEGQRKRVISFPIPLGGAKCLPLLCWPSLREFGLSCNRISKVERLGLLCPKLEVLDLGSNNLVFLGWSQESAFFGLRCLRVLDVGQNRLEGRSLWESLRYCPLLHSLVASRNRLQELPTHDGSVFLRELWLNGNSIKCFSCSAWLPNLQRLYLQDNEIETVYPIWGFPALEVLDLSFNKISQAQQLQKLGCFSNLRSLQLNDNPVAELPNYTVMVLEAVPWLVELDNEPLMDNSRLQAVRNILSEVMSTIGLGYVQSNILNGRMPCPNVVNISVQDDGSSAWVSNSSQERNSITINKTLAGDADLHVLWAVLLNICHWYETSLCGNTNNSFSMDCQWRMQSFWLMCLDQKQRLFNSLRESTILKEGRDDSLTNASQMTLHHPGGEAIPLDEHHTGWGKPTKNSHITELELCIQEHSQFNGSPYKGLLVMNKGYELEVEIYCKQVTRLQGIIRGFLSRRHQRKCQLLSDKVCSTSFEQEHKTGLQKPANMIQAIVKFQALWRGFRARKRFLMAIEESKYEDSDDYDYAMVDDSNFFSEDLYLKDLDFNHENLQYKERYDIHELSSQLQHYFHDPKDASPCGTQEGKMTLHQGFLTRENSIAINEGVRKH